jgi:putative methionine-R-sulfoxide reductase with GAF domain
VRAEVAVPVVAEGAVVGVLDVEYVDGGPTDDDVAFLRAEAERLALELGRS